VPFPAFRSFLIQIISYKSAAKRAPRPRRPADANCTLLADAADEEPELDDADAVLDPVAEAPLEPAEPDEPEPEPDAPVAPPAPPVATDNVDAGPRTTVVDEPTLTEKYESVPLAFCARDVTPTGRPAGIVATAGWVVTPSGRPGWLVTTEGWPVTTPRELVWVK